MFLIVINYLSLCFSTLIYRLQCSSNTFNCILILTFYLLISFYFLTFQCICVIQFVFKSTALFLLPLELFQENQHCYKHLDILLLFFFNLKSYFINKFMLRLKCPPLCLELHVVCFVIAYEVFLFDSVHSKQLLLMFSHLYWPALSILMYRHLHL